MHSQVVGQHMKLYLARLAVNFDDQSLKAKCPDATFVEDLKVYLLSRDYFGLLKSFEAANGDLYFTVVLRY